MVLFAGPCLVDDGERLAGSDAEADVVHDPSSPWAKMRSEPGRRLERCELLSRSALSDLP